MFSLSEWKERKDPGKEQKKTKKTRHIILFIHYNAGRKWKCERLQHLPRIKKGEKKE